MAAIEGDGAKNSDLFKKYSKWIFFEYLNTIKTQKTGDFQATVITLSPKDIKTYIINERNLMTF